MEMVLERAALMISSSGVLVLFPVITFALAWSGTAWFREHAVRTHLLDYPNDRSMHSLPTPRGGGLVIAFTSLLGLAVLPVTGALSWSAAMGLVGGGAAVAAIGTADDRGHIAPRWRLLLHFAAAAWLLYWCGGFPVLPIFGHTVSLGWLDWLIGALYIVWMLNLTNFMDGIDGFAASQAVVVNVGAALALMAASSNSSQWVVPLVVAAAALGFLVWNWPPARIFMGDAGSGFLGFIVAGLSLVAAKDTPHLFWSWIVLSGVFVVDATLTLLVRFVRGERLYDAHRTHAYQKLALRYGEHRLVTLGLLAVNLCWFLPLALLVAARRVDGTVAALVGYLPAVLFVYRSGAGRSNAPNL